MLALLSGGLRRAGARWRGALLFRAQQLLAQEKQSRSDPVLCSHVFLLSPEIPSKEQGQRQRGSPGPCSTSLKSIV